MNELIITINKVPHTDTYRYRIFDSYGNFDDGISLDGDTVETSILKTVDVMTTHLKRILLDNMQNNCIHNFSVNPQSRYKKCLKCGITHKDL
jgi:hypothetical protein